MRSLLRRSGIWTLALALLTPAVLVGQTTIGVSGGIVRSNLEGDDAPQDLDTRTSFDVGGYVRIPMGPVLHITPGVYYVQKGGVDPNDRTLKLNYLEVPVLLDLSVFQTEGFGLNIFAGPSVAFEIRCRREVVEVEFFGSLDCEDLDTPFETKPVDLAALFGAGLSFGWTETLDVVVQSGLDLGLSSIDDRSDDGDVRNATWFGNVGLAWTIGG